MAGRDRRGAGGPGVHRRPVRADGPVAPGARLVLLGPRRGCPGRQPGGSGAASSPGPGSAARRSMHQGRLDEPGHGPEPVGCRAEGLTGPARQVTRRYWPSSPGRTRSPSAPAVRSARPCCSGGIYEFPAIEADVKRAAVWCPPARSPCWQDSGMERVLGIGGYFMRAADPAALSAWYRDCLGLDADENGLWRQGAGLTVFATFESGTGYFGSRAQQTMLNFRVRDLDAMLAQLRAKGAEVAKETQDMEGVGRFGWVTDPEGNRVELWQPA